jgi:hypothetical protein
MANEIQVTYPEGSNLYVRIRKANGDVWNTDSAVFENWADGNVTDYDIALTDEDGGHYIGNFPSAITTKDSYVVEAFIRAGGSPAVGDDFIGAGILAWDGTEEMVVIDYLDALRKNTAFERY